MPEDYELLQQYHVLHYTLIGEPYDIPKLELVPGDFVYTVSGVVVGWLRLELLSISSISAIPPISSISTLTKLLISNIFVDEKHRGEGIAKKLLQFALMFPVDVFELQVDKGNPSCDKLLKFYGSCGFKVYHETSMEYLMSLYFRNA